MVVLHDNKSSPQNQELATKTYEKPIASPFAPLPRANGVQMPMPREFNGKKYYGAEDVAKIIGVTRQTISRWNSTFYFDCPLFTADERAHDGRYLYDVERVMQLKAVYRPNWALGSYEPAPADEKQSHIAQLVHFFNQLYGKIPEPHFAYLWTNSEVPHTVKTNFSPKIS